MTNEWRVLDFDFPEELPFDILSERLGEEAALYITHVGNHSEAKEKAFGYLEGVVMAYIQLSLYGIPAVVIRGDTITLEEYDRWYTPAYLLRKWIWRAPMPFGTKRNKSDELLKMLDEPLYAAFRQAEALWGTGS